MRINERRKRFLNFIGSNQKGKIEKYPMVMKKTAPIKRQSFIY